MTNTTPDQVEGTLPDGIIELASAMLGPATVGHNLAELLTAPRRLDPTWPSPTEPVPVADGWIHADVLDQDRPLLAAVIDQHGGHGPEAVACAAQAVRLPVTPYRRVTGQGPARQPDHAASDLPGPGAETDLTGVLVVDMTTHWAGPLATRLMADAGASVIKVDPQCRPDGFGDRPAVYHHLNGNKEIADFDLREPADRTRFEQLLSTADLLVESFSRRVMINLGFGLPSIRADHRSLQTLSIKAFDINAPEADWLAYGPGVHATSGLGFRSDNNGCRPRPAAVAYPDFLTGIAGFVSACRLLDPDTEIASAAEPRIGTGHAELAMASIIRPLVTAGPSGGDKRR